jgi:hypothetical protein
MQMTYPKRIVLPDVPLTDLQMSTGLANIIVESGLKTIGQILHKPAIEVMSLRGMGVAKMRELTGLILQAGFSVPWLGQKHCAIELSSLPIDLSEWALIARYEEEDGAALESAICQLHPIAWRILRYNGAFELYRSRSGYKEVGEE